MGFLQSLLKKKKVTPHKVNKSLQKTESTRHSIVDNVNFIKEGLKHTSDLVCKTLKEYNAVLMYLESVADQEKIQKKVIVPLSESKEGLQHMHSSGRSTSDLNQAIIALLKGHAVLIHEDAKALFLYNVTSTYNRSVEEPENEKVVRGSHEGFVENLLININLIRKRIENPELCVRYFKAGKKSNTKIAIAYLDGLADPEVVRNVENRIRSISSDMISSPGHVEEFIEDSPFSPFPQMLNTERPDRATAHIMEGRIAVLSEGSPTALIVPVTFCAFYQSPDDYNGRWLSGTYLRMFRLMSFVIAVGLPAFYIGVIGYHFEVIPDELVLPIKASVNDIAYPPLIEALVMVVTIELIREAGLRLPSPVGQTIGIVGGLVIGDAVVRAGLISNIMVVIIATTAIASFVVPSNEMSTTLRLLIYPMIIAAATFGFVGMAFAFMFLFIHLCKLESFGTPYITPIAPLRVKDLKDTFIRMPLWKMDASPSDSQSEETTRETYSRGWKDDEDNEK